MKIILLLLLSSLGFVFAYQTCNSTSVYRAEIVLQIDAQMPAEEFALPMDPERDTPAYRQAAIDFINLWYGLDLSQPIDGIEFLAQKVNPAILYKITALSITYNNGTTLSGSGLDDAQMLDDYYNAFLLKDTTVYGVWGGRRGKNVVKGSSLFYGTYSPVARCKSGDLVPIMDPFIFRAICPFTATDFDGSNNVDLSTGTFGFNCETESPSLGIGRSTGVSINAKLPGRPDSDRTREIRGKTVITFPSSLFDEVDDVRPVRCENISPGRELCNPTCLHAN